MLLQTTRTVPRSKRWQWAFGRASAGLLANDVIILIVHDAGEATFGAGPRRQPRQLFRRVPHAAPMYVLSPSQAREIIDHQRTVIIEFEDATGRARLSRAQPAALRAARS